MTEGETPDNTPLTPLSTQVPSSLFIELNNTNRTSHTAQRRDSNSKVHRLTKNTHLQHNVQYIWTLYCQQCFYQLLLCIATQLMVQYVLHAAERPFLIWLHCTYPQKCRKTLFFSNLGSIEVFILTGEVLSTHRAHMASRLSVFTLSNNV